MSIIKDFKAFISRGNVMDMAIGVIIGGAFGKIVTSLVNDIVMPGIGYLIGGLDFADMKYVMSPAVLDKAGEIVTPEVAICYGNFINTRKRVKNNQVF
ncbi:MAG TPA: large conductance mechanosensitive channel protein MscL, partial [Saccharofermentans sp.]|nr:large conductance mechanosensitive channel protein MscL [Saccharofermentans sp.]